MGVPDETPYGHDLTFGTLDDPPLPANSIGASFRGASFESDGNDALHEPEPPPPLGGLSLGLGLSFWLRAPPDTYYWYDAILRRDDSFRLVSEPGGFGSQSDAIYPHGLRFSVTSAEFPGGDGGPAVADRFVRFGAHNRWAHVVLSYDGDAGFFDAYVNGARRASLRVNGDLSDSAAGLHLFSRDEGANSEWGLAGRIEDLRVFGRALSPVEALRLYTTETPHWHWRLDGSAADDGPLGATGTVSGGASWDEVRRWQGESLALDGVDDDLVIPHDDGFDHVSQQLTSSLWVRASAGAVGTVIAKGGPTSAPFEVDLQDRDYPTPDTITIRLRGASGAITPIALDVPEVAETWVNVQIAFDASRDGTYTALAEPPDGTGVEASGELGEPLATSAAGITLGRDDSTSPAWFGGNVDDVWLFARALDERERRQLRSSLSASFLWYDDGDPTTDPAQDASPFGRMATPKHAVLAPDGLEIASDGHVLITPDEVDDEYWRSFTIAFEARIPAALQSLNFCFVSLGAMATRGLPRVCVETDPEGDHTVLVMPGGRTHRLTAFDWSAHRDEFVPVVVQYDRYGLPLARMSVGGHALSIYETDGYVRWDAGFIAVGAQSARGDGTWPFAIRNLRVHRRWAE